MCEILVCIKDRSPTGDPTQDCIWPKQGDVVSIQDDGWAWGLAELGQVGNGNPTDGNHNFFRIFKLPNVTVSQASKMIAPQVQADPLNPAPYLAYRAFYFDKTKIPAGLLQTYWNDDTRSAPFITLTYTATQLNTIVTQRPLAVVGAVTA